MLARRLPPPPPAPGRARIVRPDQTPGARRSDGLVARRAEGSGPRRADGAAARRAEGRWRRAGPQPTRSPRGQTIHWWERPAPRGDEALWRAVRVVQEERLRVGVTVTALARRLEALGRPLRRETVSRVLQGKQATSWETVEALGQALGVALEDRSSSR